ncbi:MAG: OsmC family protein [Actinomycetota bacterium]
MSITETSTQSPAADNGVNVEALLGARQAMTEMPEAAQFEWKANSEWVNGTHTAVSVEEFFGAGADQSHVQTFVYDVDHPTVFAAEDKGITPVEYLLVGLAGCLTAGVASVAQNRGVQLRSVKATLSGDMDLAGILGIDPDVRNGFSGLKVAFDIDADATPEEIQGLVAQSQKRSAVYDALANPTPIAVEVN